jgi:hypothetical protein
MKPGGRLYAPAVIVSGFFSYSRISIANASIAPSAALGRFFASLAEIRRQAICERKVAGIRAACRKGKILLDRDASKNRQRSGCEWALGTSTPPCCQLVVPPRVSFHTGEMACRLAHFIGR